MTTMIEKVEKSFFEQFGYECRYCVIEDGYANVMGATTFYYCKLTKNGVKKNSWRLEK